jgi:hypothetical protein
MITTLAVLNSRIPAGGFGRPLTSTERRALRSAGYAVATRAIVVSDGADHIGNVYNPDGQSRFANAGIRVSMK